MIDPTAICLGPMEIGSRTYIGPFCVLGFPAIEDASAVYVESGIDKRPGSRGVKIGADSILLSHVVIGEGSVLGKSIWCDHHCYIGSDTHIADDVQIMYGARIYDRVKIGRGAWVGGFVCNDAIIEEESIVLGQLVHRFVEASVEEPEEAPIVRAGAFIGMNALVIGGIEVGRRAYVAGGAVLTKSAIPGRLYLGVPAKNVGPAPSPFKFLDRS